MNSKSVHKNLLESYQKIQLSQANEASTRLKVIDRVIKEVLGWTDDDISPEEHVTEDNKTTYADYVLRTANSAIIVEAKKVGASFSFEPSTLRKQKLSSTFVAGELGEAIIQARDYARKMGIDFAAITNGSAWIVFPAQRHDQVQFNDSYALIFPSLISALKDNYQEFVELLSRDSVVDGSLEVRLIGRYENQFGTRKLGHAFTATHRPQPSNPIYPLIEEAVVTAFSDSIAELDAISLEKCYVSTPETIKFDNRINLHISKREHLFLTQPSRPMKTSESNVLREKLVNSVSKVKPLAILILGSVGSGKTTFLHYTRKVKAADIFNKKKDSPYPHWVYIDFRNCQDQSAALDFIYRQLLEYIISDGYFSDYNRCVKNAYKKEVDALKSGPLFLIANKEENFNTEVTKIMTDDYNKIIPYVDKLFIHASKQSAIFLVIDNVDQFEQEEDQSRLFSETISLGHKLGINLVMSIRGSTYAKYRNSATFDAFDFDPLQIDPPKISSVLSKRFALAKQLLNGKKGEFIAANGAHVKLDNVADIIELVQSSVLGTEIGNRIEVLSTEDVRLALRMTREFLEFGYSDPGGAWQTYKRKGSYIMPKQEAFRAILLGNRRVYSEEYSPIANPFDSKLSITSAQLLRLYVLSGIVNFATSQTFRHIDGTAIAESLRKIGFGDAISLRILQDLCRYRFLHTASQNEPDLHSSFFPTRLGGYIVRDLIAYFVFLENVMFDTFIADNIVWEKMRDLSHEIEGTNDKIERIKKRIERVKSFVMYLEQLYVPLESESRKRNLAAEWCTNPFDEAKTLMNNEYDRVLSSAQKNYGKSNNGNTIIHDDD